MSTGGKQTSLRSSRRAKEKGLWNYRAISLTSIPGNVMEELTLETISRHIKKMKGIRRSQHGFTKEKSCLTNVRAFCDEMTGLVGEGTEVDIVYLDVSKTVDTVSHKILIERPLMYRLDEKTVGGLKTV